jgi:hypothetical protein
MFSSFIVGVKKMLNSNKAKKKFDLQAIENRAFVYLYRNG